MGVPKPLDEIIIARPNDITPSSEDMKVIGVCNPGGTLFKKDNEEKTYLLLRIIEANKEQFPGHVAFPRAIPNNDSEYKVIWEWERLEKDAVKTSSSSLMTTGLENRARLTTISHLRLAESEDGINFIIDKKPTFFPIKKYEEFGIEDARITKFEEGIPIDNQKYNYLISYVALSEEHDICTAFALTNDFKSFIRIPKEDPKIIFYSPSKDVVLFPKKFVNSRTKKEDYLALTRPQGSGFMIPSVYLSYSNDLIQWGDNIPLIRGSEKGHVGAGPPPIELDEGWLIIYHQHRHYNNTKEYIGTAILTDKSDPSRILKRADEFLKSHLEIGVEPVVKNVTFPSAATLKNDKIFIYSGEEDAVTAVHVYNLKDLMDFLKPIN